MAEELQILYQQIADITKPLCMSGSGCGVLAQKPYHCCEKKYCDMAAKFALDGYGIVLQPTGHEIPFMGPTGCTIPLHLRPICTIHCCAITWAQHSAENPEYFELRQKIFDSERIAGRKIPCQ